MKRFLVLLIVVAAAAAAAAPWWTGQRAEQQYQAYRELLQEDASFEVVEHEYQRGWLRSRATTVLGPRVGESETDEALSPLRIEVRDEIEHGPIPWSSLGATWTPMLARVHSELRMEWGEDDPESSPLALEIDTEIGFDGSAEGRVHSQGFERELGPDLELSWQGMKGRWSYDPQATRVVGTFGAPALELLSQDGDLVLRGLEFDFDYRDDPDGIPLGETRLAVAELSSPASDDDSPELRAEGLEFIHFLEVEGRNADTAVSARWESYLHEGETRDGGYLQIALSNLDAPTLAKMLKAMEQTTHEEADATAAAPLLLLMPALLERAQLELQVGLAEDAVLRASASLDGSAVGGSPLGALAQLVVDLEASAEAAFVEEWVAEALAARAETPGAKLEANPRARELLRELEDRALIVSDGERYATQVRYRQLQLEVNGRPVDPRSLSGLGDEQAPAQAQPVGKPLPGPIPTWPAAPAP